MHDFMQAAHGGPRNLLIPGADHFMSVVELIEMGVQRTRQRVVHLSHTGRVDMDGEILASRIPRKNQRVVGERAGQLDGIAVWPVECSGDDAFLLFEHQFQSEMFHGKSPGACNGRLFCLDRADRNWGAGKDENCEYQVLHLLLLSPQTIWPMMNAP